MRARRQSGRCGKGGKAVVDFRGQLARRGFKIVAAGREEGGKAGSVGKGGQVGKGRVVAAREGVEHRSG